MLDATQRYLPPSSKIALLIRREQLPGSESLMNLTLVSSFNSRPFLYHVISGSGIPDALMVIYTKSSAVTSKLCNSCRNSGSLTLSRDRRRSNRALIFSSCSSSWEEDSDIDSGGRNEYHLTKVITRRGRGWRRLFCSQAAIRGY